MKYFGILCALLTLACGNGHQAMKPSQVIQPTLISSPVVSLLELGEYSHAVRLQRTEASTIGVISEVKLDQNGDILVADLKSAEKVFRFDSEGTYLTSYGNLGEGTAEYEDLHAFAMMDNGTVVLVSSSKILLFNKDGSYLNSAPQLVNSHWLETEKDRIFVYASSGLRNVKNTAMVFDDTLEQVDAFHPYDTRIDKLVLPPRHGMSRSNDALFLSDFYKLQISAYDFQGQALYAYQLPDSSENTDSLWKKNLSNDETRALIMGLHRVHHLFSVKNLLVFSEVYPKDKVFRLNLLDIPKQTLTRYPTIQLLSLKDEGFLTMTDLVGRHGDALIGTCEDADLFHKYQQQHPALAETQFQNEDNALLLFFSLKAAQQ